MENKVIAKLFMSYVFEKGSLNKDYEKSVTLEMQNEKTLTDDTEVMAQLLEDYLNNPVIAYGDIEYNIFSCLNLSNNQKKNIIKALLENADDDVYNYVNYLNKTCK